MFDERRALAANSSGVVFWRERLAIGIEAG